MLNFYKAHIIRLFSSLECKFLFAYLFLGTIFTIFPYSNLNCLQIFLYEIIEPHYLSLFVYPSFLLLFYLNFKYIRLNTNLILRLKNRKEYLKMQFITMFLCTFLLFLFLLLMLFLFCIVLSNGQYIITMTFQYQIPGIFLLIIVILKVFCTCLLLGLFTIALLLRFKNASIAFVLLTFILGLLFLGNRIYSNHYFLDFFNIAFHSHGVAEANNFLYLIVSDSLYFGSMWFLLGLYCHKICNKTKIGMVE